MRRLHLKFKVHRRVGDHGLRRHLWPRRRPQPRRLRPRATEALTTTAGRAGIHSGGYGGPPGSATSTIKARDTTTTMTGADTGIGTGTHTGRLSRAGSWAGSR